MRKRFYLLSLGCPKNTVDAEAMAGLLEEAGWSQTARPERADVLIVNTCGFIDAAMPHAKSRTPPCGNWPRPSAVGSFCWLQDASHNAMAETYGKQCRALTASSAHGSGPTLSPVSRVCWVWSQALLCDPRCLSSRPCAATHKAPLPT